MLKFVFWALLAANAVWFAASHGYLGNVTSDEHEPARLQNQLGAEKMIMLSAQEAQETLAGAAVVEEAPALAPDAPPEPGPVQAPAAALVCMEVSNLREADARRFDARLAKLDLASPPVRREVPPTDFSSYIVFIPPQPTKEAADRKAAELKALDVTNFFIMNADSPMKWAISLGVFKSEAAAQTQLAALVKQGVHSAKVAGRSSGTRIAYEFRGIDAATSARIERMAATYDGQATRACK